VTRDDVLAVILKHLRATVEEARDAPIDPSMSMAQLGATSLDMVEIVSLCMRELKVKVPRAELAKLTTIDALADLLYQSKSRAAPSAP
jgi:acyl carrier protein